MSVCMYVSKYACLLLFVRVYACMYVRMSLCVHVCMQACRHGRTDGWMYASMSTVPTHYYVLVYRCT